MALTSASFDVKNLTKVLQLGTQNFCSSSEHPKHDSETIPKEEKNHSIEEHLFIWIALISFTAEKEELAIVR